MVNEKIAVSGVSHSLPVLSKQRVAFESDIVRRWHVENEISSQVRFIYRLLSLTQTSKLSRTKAVLYFVG